MVVTVIPALPSEVLFLVVGYFVSGLLSLAVSFFAIRRRSDSPTVGSFGVLLLFTSIWCFGFMARILSQSVESKLIWLLIGYVGLVSFPTSLLIFSLQYSGKRGWVTPHTVALLGVVPVFFILALSTNSIHGSFFTNTSVSTETGWALLAVKPEPLYWVNVVYNYLLYLFSLALNTDVAMSSKPDSFDDSERTETIDEDSGTDWINLEPGEEVIGTTAGLNLNARYNSVIELNGRLMYLILPAVNL